MRRRWNGELGCLVPMLAVFLVAIGVLVAAIHTETEGGECIGMTDWPQRDTTVDYQLSTRNVLIGIVTIETLVIPAYIALETAMCPVATPDSVEAP